MLIVTIPRLLFRVGMLLRQTHARNNFHEQQYVTYIIQTLAENDVPDNFTARHKQKTIKLKAHH